jgi:hypothetical protein
LAPKDSGQLLEHRQRRADPPRLRKGKLVKIEEYVKAAQTDYRDILYWAEYYKNDPLLRARNPKQMANEIIAKWGKKSEE